MSDRLVVTGFGSHGELDRFVRSEIRYFRSREMRAYRSEAPDRGPALVLAFRDHPDLAGAAKALSRSYAGLTLTWSREEPGQTVVAVFEAGKPAPARTSRSSDPDDAWPELEEIYSTF